MRHLWSLVLALVLTPLIYIAAGVSAVRLSDARGLGSTAGCLVGALLVGLVANYTGFLAPKAALFSNIALMVLVLLWRPEGLYPVARRAG